MNTKLFLTVASASFLFGVAHADLKQDINNLANAARGSSNADWMQRSVIRANADKAFAAYAKYAGTTNVTAKDLDNLIGGALIAAYNAVDTVFARGEAERALSNDTLSAATHVRAIQYLAAGDIEKGHFALAEARYDAFLKDYKLDRHWPYPYADAWTGKASVKWLQRDKPGAVAVLEKAIAGLPQGKDGAWVRGQVFPRLRDALFTYLPRDKAFDYYVAKGWRTDALHLCYSVFRADDRIAGGEKAKALARKMVTDKNSPSYERIEGWLYLLARDPAFADAHGPLRPTDDVGCTNGVAHHLRWAMEQQYLIRYSTENTLRAWKMMKRCLDATKGKPEFSTVEISLQAFASACDRTGFAETAAFYLAKPKIPDHERYELALALEMLKMKGTADEIAAAIAKVEPTLAGKLPAKQRLQYFCRAGGMVQRFMDENLTRGVAAYREKVKPDFPKKTYVVKYSETPVTGIADFSRLAFKPEESAMDRPYGGETASMFESDVSTGNRGSATKGGDGSATLSVVADKWGVHFLRIYRDKRARDFESGFLDPGTFEEYVAPGENQPYTCMLFAPKKGAKANFFQTSYGGMGCRRPDATDPASFRIDVLYTDDAILTYTGISWNNYPTLIPANGATWDFESCYWGPKTLAWNGLKTVHGRSSWGLLKFELSEKARLAIVRDQICRAASRYRHERDHWKLSEGVLYLWQDPVTGDPAFYQAKLVPLAAELDAVVKRVKPDMTAEDVKDIAENYLMKLAYFRVYVERLRADWLQEQL